MPLDRTYGTDEASMTTTVDAIYENGVFKPEHPVGLAEKTKVHLVIETTSPPAEDDDHSALHPPGWRRRSLVSPPEGGAHRASGGPAAT